MARPGAVTDPDLIAQKLAFIETCVQELRTLARPAEMRHDVREARFVLHTLQIAIQAALDVASHIVSDERLGEPESRRELFDRLAGHGWLSTALADTMGRMTGFRNIVVHGYGGVNLEIARDIVERRLGDLLAFTAAIRARLP
jgi:uncharacterized protein YutE (UPF0331/DUF86 family)